MHYETVTLEAKTVVGLSGETSNNDPNIGQVIGGLWQDFYNKGVYASIENKANDCSIGLYNDYETDENGLYTVTVGCEVTEAQDIPQGATVKTIPAGKYAKFVVEGDMVTAVQAFWENLWNTPLPRTYTGDFEEYQPGNNMEHAIIHIYIAIQ